MVIESRISVVIPPGSQETELKDSALGNSVTAGAVPCQLRFLLTLRIDIIGRSINKCCETFRIDDPGLQAEVQ